MKSVNNLALGFIGQTCHESTKVRMKLRSDRGLLYPLATVAACLFERWVPTLEASGGHEPLDSGQFNFDWIVGFNGCGDTVGRLVLFRCIGAKEVVPKHKYLSVVLVDVGSVASMVNPVIGWGCHEAVQPTQFSNGSHNLVMVVKPL